MKTLIMASKANRMAGEGLHPGQPSPMRLQSAASAVRRRSGSLYI